MPQIVPSERGRRASNPGGVVSAARTAAGPDSELISALQRKADGSAAVSALRSMGHAVQRAGAEEEEPMQARFAAAQRQAMPEEEEALQGRFKAIQRVGGLEEEEPLQGRFAATVQRQWAGPQSEAGLPARLRQGIERLSGVNMDGVRVHYGSSAPAQLEAHAFAQGSDIHLAPGQEKHLPHEAWHVVQQAQGRVEPTTDMGGTPVNDDLGLEAEADRMGERARNG